MVNSCSIPEYDAYLEQEAERSQENRVAVTYLLKKHCIMMRILKGKSAA